MVTPRLQSSSLRVDLVVAVVLLTMRVANAQTDRAKAYAPPVGGAWFGSVPGTSDLDQYDASLTAKPASYVFSVDLPLSITDKYNLTNIAPQIAKRGAMLVLNVGFNGPNFTALTDADFRSFAAELARHEGAGTKIIISWAKEMNGNWYEYGQKPKLYRTTYRRMAAAVYNATKTAAMLWAPNIGTGYPFPGGQYAIQCNFTAATVSQDCLDLDTNGDKQITGEDDMYTPYYPGDDVVDFVGLAILNFGNAYPFGANVVAEPGKYASIIKGEYNGAQGDFMAVPNFYALFSEPPRSKPLVVTATASLYNLCDLTNTTSACRNQTNPPSERQIKEAWWTQVYNVRGDSPNGPDIAASFPNLQFVHWFDLAQNETEAQNNTVNWSISKDASIRSAFLSYVAQPRLLPDGTTAATPYWRFAL